MGTGPFAVPSFDALRQAGHEIRLVVTRPMPPVKSRKGPPPAPVRRWAEGHGLPIFDPESVNEPDAVERIAEADVDLLVVCDYGQILKPDVLAASRLGGINLHGSLLPAHRGAAPVQWSLWSGDQVTGVSVIHMTPRLDAGPILVTRQTEISSDETAGELEERLARLGVDATLEAVDLLRAWDRKSPIGEPQDQSKASKAPRLKKSDGQIDWSKSARQIDCQVRAMQPWPVAFTFLKTDANKPPLRIAIKQVRVSDRSSDGYHPGEVASDDGLEVASGDRMVEILRLQPAGKREMDGQEFLRGHRPAPGAKFESV